MHSEVRTVSSSVTIQLRNILVLSLQEVIGTDLGLPSVVLVSFCGSLVNNLSPEDANLQFDVPHTDDTDLDEAALKPSFHNKDTPPLNHL